MRINLTTIILFTSLLLFIFQDAEATSQVNIYQYTKVGMFSPATQKALYRVYVPNSESSSVSVIDPKTYKVIQTFYTGKNPQHVVPSYNMQTLWLLNNKSN